MTQMKKTKNKTKTKKKKKRRGYLWIYIWIKNRQKQKTSKDQTTEWKSNSTPKYTHAHLFSLSPFCDETHWKTEKGRSHMGMTIVTVSGAPTLASAPASAPQLLPALASRWITGAAEAQEMPGPGWYISHDGWSCCPPHWYSARLRRWARSLTLNGYLLPQSPPASGAQRGSVSGQKRLNGAPKRPGLTEPVRQPDSHSSHSLLQMDYGAQGGLRSGQADPGILRGS